MAFNIHEYNIPSPPPDMTPEALGAWVKEMLDMAYNIGIMEGMEMANASSKPQAGPGQIPSIEEGC